jgi:hypothetical protein
MTELNKGEWRERGQKQEVHVHLTQFQYDFLQIFFTSCKFQTWNLIMLTCIARVSKLKNNFEDENKIYLFFFCYFGKFKLHFSS